MALTIGPVIATMFGIAAEASPIVTTGVGSTNAALGLPELVPAVLGSIVGASALAAAVFGESPNPIALVRIDGGVRVVAVNPAFDRAFEGEWPIVTPREDGGIPAPGGNGSALARVLGEHTVEDAREVLEANETAEYVHESGDERSPVAVQVVSTPTTEDVDGYVLVERDRQLLERLETLERRNERLEEFAGRIAHDLRNPLDVAEAHLHGIERTGEQQYVDTVRDALGRMEGLIGDILLLSRTGEVVGEREDVSLAAVSREAWNGVDTDGATLEVEGDRELRADPERMQDLLANLFRNAIEHADTDEAVTVTVGPTEAGFHVSDDGPGVDPEVADIAFEPGVSGGDDGTGLGLSIVERIATGHGWSVSLTDATTGGARFEFDLTTADE